MCFSNLFWNRYCLHISEFHNIMNTQRYIDLLQNKIYYRRISFKFEQTFVC